MDDLRGERMVLCPLAEADADALRAIRSTASVAEWWGPPEADFPLSDEPEATRFTIVHDGSIAGMIQFGEEPEPEYRHAWIDIFVDPRRHRQGLGSDAIVTLLRHLAEVRGHHRVTIDPAAENVGAIRCYEKVGFRPVGTMQSAWRDPAGRWRDVLLMEWVTRSEMTDQPSPAGSPIRA